MIYLWDDIKNLLSIIKQSRKILLLVDYDGTIVPIKPIPQQVKLSESTKILLQKLKVKLHGNLGIISGRSLIEIKKQVGIRGLIYAGNHGMEWTVKGKRYTVARAKKFIYALPKIKKSLKILEDKFRGVFIEDKHLTLAVHYRLLQKKYVNSFHRYIKYLLEPYLKAYTVSLLNGKMVYELMLPLNWNKGDFIKLCMEKYFHKSQRHLLTIYIGDDRTDEEAFLKLKDVITIKVGRGQSSARYFVKNQKEVINFLKLLVYSHRI